MHGEELTNQATSIAEALVRVPEKEAELERFFAELQAKEEEDDDGPNNKADEVAR